MDNREKILQCAEELFYSRGYDAAGVQEIVEMAGVTKPTLYYYFGSKRGLLEAILEAKSGKLHRSIARVQPYLVEFYCSVRQVFEQAAFELGNMRGRQEQFAISFIGAVHQYLVFAWDKGTLEDKGTEQMEELVNQYLYGIFS